MTWADNENCPGSVSNRVIWQQENLKRASPTRIENKTDIDYQKRGPSIEEQRKNIATANAAELAKIEASQAKEIRSIAASSTSSASSIELIDGDLAKEALKAGENEKELASLLQQMKTDARHQAKIFKDKWRAYLQARQKTHPKSPGKISGSESS